MLSQKRIAFVSQPWETFLAPFTFGGSIQIIMYNLAARLAQSNRVLIYSRRVRGSRRREVDGKGIEHRRIVCPNKVYRGLDLLSGLLNSK
ncbi:MAG: hypothetical protein ACREBC_09225, partial [Pyrinomonadaceae bacterium]